MPRDGHRGYRVPTGLWAERMRQALRESDYAMAVEAARCLIEVVPGSEDARASARECQAVLLAKVIQRLGGPDVRLRVSATGALERALRRDARVALLVVMVESGFSLGDIADACEPRSYEALQAIEELVVANLLQPL